MAIRRITYRVWTVPDFDYDTEKEADLASLQQQIHMLSAGAKDRNYTFRTDNIRKLLDEYDKIDKDPNYGTPTQESSSQGAS